MKNILDQYQLKYQIGYGNMKYLILLTSGVSLFLRSYVIVFSSSVMVRLVSSGLIKSASS